MKKTSKILAASSIFAYLGVIGGSLALGLGYSGALFSLLPVLSLIGISTLGPILIATTALFVSLSLILSISFLRSRQLEKKNLKEQSGEKEEKKEEKKEEELEINITDEQVIEERNRVRDFSEEDKERYIKRAIKNFDQLAIKVIVDEKDLFKDALHKNGDFAYYAAKEGSYGLVKYMVEDLGVDPNEPFGDSLYSSIYYAIVLGNTKTLKCLLDNGVDPTKIRYRFKGVIRDLDRQPLMIAALGLETESIKLLLDMGEVKANINALNLLGDTALIEIFKLGGGESLSQEGLQAQYDIAELLLENGADPIIQSKEGKTALEIAKENNSNERAILLLETAEKQAEDKKELLIKGQEDITEAQVKEEQARVRYFSKKEKIEYFKLATLNLKKLDIKVIFSENGELFKDIMPKSIDLVYYAAKEGGDRVVKYMIEDLEIDLNQPFGDSEYPPVVCAIVSNDTEVLRCLVDNGADPNISSGSMTPLIMAARYFQKTQVELLLTTDKVRANINAKSFEGNSALIQVLKKKCQDSSKGLQYDIAELLLENGINPTIKNDEGQTALDIAKSGGYESKVISLLEEAEEKWKKEHEENYTDKVVKSKKLQTIINIF